MSAAGKRCPRCKLRKPLRDFYIRASGPQKGQPHSYCKPCLRVYNRLQKSGAPHDSLSLALAGFDRAAKELAEQAEALRCSMRTVVAELRIAKGDQVARSELATLDRLGAELRRSSR